MNEIFYVGTLKTHLVFIKTFNMIKGMFIKIENNIYFFFNDIRLIRLFEINEMKNKIYFTDICYLIPTCIKLNISRLVTG